MWHANCFRGDQDRWYEYPETVTPEVKLFPVGQVSFRQDGDPIKLREGGLLGIINLNLDATGSFAMRGKWHPITQTGLEYLMKNIKKDLHKGLQARELSLLEHGERLVYGRRTRRVEGVFPKDRSKGYYCYRIIIDLDIENRLPVRVQVFEWDDELVERYGYENLELAAGLTDFDFDAENPGYRV